MRIISQNGRVDLKYDDAIIYAEEQSQQHPIPNEKQFLLRCMCSGTDLVLGSYDTLEEAKSVLLSIAKGYRHNYQTFFLSEKEEVVPEKRGLFG